jgi:tetratricopeptide (TPR) repeat protein
VASFAGLLCFGMWSAQAPAQSASWQSAHNAAVAAYQAGDYAAAEAYLLTALNQAEHFGRRDPRLAATLNDLALTHFRQGKYAEAEPLHQRALQMRERIYGSEHPKVAAILNDLGFLYAA